ncbi:gephyrin-like molybdotransferase Glp [Rathayibacter sp. YIM 133350]|uniref:molybdopterin molybdotransferase MoeA n=1 Tax=Rathayibacter sp. YIM 133350 TaxID=3131992 RepID=UPI00307F1AF7
MRSVAEQRALVAAAVQPLAAIELPLAEAAGRTLAVDVTSRLDIPVFDNSAMDGYAVRHRDVAAAAPDAAVQLRIVADLPAGSAEDPRLGTGEAARIMTGSAVPTDADAIVPVENTLTGAWSDATTVAVTVAAEPGAYIRRAGADLHAGDLVLGAGTVLKARHLAAAAAAGRAKLSVVPEPRVSIISTGSELAAPDAVLTRGRIPESNSVLLRALVRDTGARVMRTVTVADDPAELRAEFDRAASEADVVILSGGVSVGAYDVVKQVLQGTLEFVSVAMQPGKPQAFGRLPGGPLAFGLPGNPVSVAVSFEVFVRPALLALQGRGDMLRPTLEAVTASGWRTPPGREQYMPVIFEHEDGAVRVRPATAGGSGSHLAGGLAHADGFAVIPADVDEVHAGSPVTVMLVP